MTLNIIPRNTGRLELSAQELGQMTGWPSPLIEDYLNTIRYLQQIADAFDNDLGTMALQNADAVDITGGSISNVTMDNIVVQDILIDNASVTNANVVSLTVSGQSDVQDLTVNEDLIVIGNTTLGDSSADTLTINAGTATFAASGARIRGDFSNATIANRVMFQTSTANSNTLVRAIPSGTDTTGALQAGNSSDPNNQSVTTLQCEAAAAVLYSNKTGTGTLLPLKIGVNNTAAIEIDTSNNTTVKNNLSVGDSSADTLTINAGTWTIGSNYTATRAAGVAAAGLTFFGTLATSFSGDAGGTTNGRALLYTTDVRGTNNVAQGRGVQQNIECQMTAGTLALGVANTITATNTNAAAVTELYAQSATVAITGSGNVTTAANYIANAPSVSSTGAFTTLTGYRSGNLGHATLVTNAIGFDAQNMTVSPTLTVSYRSQQNSGTGAWGFLHTGTANNAFRGKVRIGSTVVPTVELDLTGDEIISGGLSVGSPTGGLIAGSINAAAIYVNGVAVGSGGGLTQPQVMARTLGC